MSETIIADKDIPTADPAVVVEQYAAWIQKLANKYQELANQSNFVDKEDLQQSGIIGLLEAQRNYDPDKGCSFLTYSFSWIRNSMLGELGFRDSKRYRPPQPLLSLDAPISEEASDTLLDSIDEQLADPNFVPFDEKICDEETRSETAQAVRKAIDRLPHARQREAITRVYLQGQSRQQAAADMNIGTSYLYQLNKAAITRLRNDHELRDYVMPFYHIGVSRFNSTMTSAVELAVIWREYRATMLQQLLKQEGNKNKDHQYFSDVVGI